MTLAEFKAAPIGVAILEDLEKIKECFIKDVTSVDLLSASFFCYKGITEKDGSNREMKDQLYPYIQTYKDIISQILVNYLGIDEGVFLRWAPQIYSSINALSMYQYCELCAPTHAHNKDFIH